MSARPIRVSARGLRVAAAGSLLCASIAIGGPSAAADPPPVPTASQSPTDPTSPSEPASSTPPAPTPTPTPTPARTPTTHPPTHPTTTAPKKPLTVAIEFDDGTADQFQTGALLAARNMAGVYFVNSGRIGLTASYLTAAELTQLQADGHEIGGHTVFHLHLPQQSVAEQRRQICLDRDQLLARGLRVTDLAVPFGEYTAATLEVARGCGYNSVRTIEAGANGTDTIPPANPYEMKAVSSLGAKTSASQIVDAIRDAQRPGGGFMQIVFHRICTGGPCRPNAIRLSVFTEVLDWLAGERATAAVRIDTVAGVIGGPVRPPVAGPAATATVGVPNASFEQGTTTPDDPVCWEHTISGDDNVATWSLTRQAHSGGWAEHLVTRQAGAGIGLVVTQDEGTCAAPGIVGHQYTYGVWYRSSAPVHLVAYRRLSAGGYLTYGLSKPFAESPNAWTYASVTTRPLPVGTTGVSIGIAIRDPGDFSFDDFSLVDAGPPQPKPALAPAPVARDDSPPSIEPVAIPVVAAAAVTATPHHSSWSEVVWIGGVLLMLALALATIDWRLARIRRR